MIVLLTCCVTATILLTACGSDETNNSSAAKGEVNLYTSQPEADAQKLIASFNKKYPDIRIKVFRSGTEEIVSKIMAEKKMGKVQADVVLVSDAATFEQLKKRDIMDAYESPEAKNIPAELVDKDHTYVGTKVMATGIIYNTNIIKQPPVSFKDLLAPAYKNQEIIPSPLYSGAAAYNLSILTRTSGLGWDFYQGLKDNNVMVDKGNGNVLNAVSEGTKGIGLIVDYMAIRAKAKGAPVDFIYPSEGVPVITEPIGVVKNSTNENLAKIFEDFVLSEEGQKITADIGYTPIRKGIQVPEGFKSIDEMKILAGNITEIVKNRDVDKQKFTVLFQ